MSNGLDEIITELLHSDKRDPNLYDRHAALVLSELKRGSVERAELEKGQQAILIRLAKIDTEMKIKAQVHGGVTGLIVSLVVGIAIAFIKTKAGVP
jgi:hypothetical protein